MFQSDLHTTRACLQRVWREWLQQRCPPQTTPNRSNLLSATDEPRHVWSQACAPSQWASRGGPQFLRREVL